MRAGRTWIGLAGLLFLNGCILSWHPLYTEQDLAFEANLIGEWIDEESGAEWAFSQRGTNTYTLVYTDSEGRSGTFKADLLRIDQHLFLNIFPENPELEQNDFYRAHLLRLHSFALVRQINPRLQISFPDYKWLEQLLVGEPDAIQHEIRDNLIVLTAPTDELQAFWLSHVASDSVFHEYMDMRRREPSESRPFGTVRDTEIVAKRL